MQSVSYVCNGSSQGHQALVRVVSEPPGSNCPEGGLAIEVGIDENDDGKLQHSEVTSTSYACNTQGGTSLVRLDPEPPGVNCPEGGTAIKSGIDLNHDGTLQDSEVTSTSYACNAPPLGGGVLQGSFTVHNSLDVEFLAGFVGLTGDLVIEAPGLQQIALPALTSIGGELRLEGTGAPQLEVLDLPALEAIGTLNLYPSAGSQGWDSLTAVDIGALQHATVIHIGRIPNMAVIDAPSLLDVGTIDFYQSVTSWRADALTSAELVSDSSPGLTLRFPSLTSGTIVITSPVDYTLDVPALASADSLVLPVNQDVMLPALIAAQSVTLTFTGDFGVALPVLQMAHSVSASGVAGQGALSAPALQHVDVLSLGGLADATVPSLSSAGSVGVGGMTVSLPSLTTCDQFTTDAQFTAPLLVQCGLNLQDYKDDSFDLPSLQVATSVSASRSTPHPDLIVVRLNGLLQVTGSVDFNDARMNELDVPELSAIDGDFVIGHPAPSAPAAITILDISSLASVGGRLAFAAGLGVFSAPSLTVVGQSIEVGYPGSCYSWQCPPCPSGNYGLVSITMPNLTTLGPPGAGQLIVGYDPQLPYCTARALRDQLLAHGWNGAYVESCPLAGSQANCP